MQKLPWWTEGYGLFGEFYMEGDNSLGGYLQKRKQTLEERTKTEVDGVIKLLNLQQSMAILDIPCGYGRHSLELARRGFSVIGVDINSIHLQKARKELAEENIKIEFVQENMLDISFNKKFDAVINMFYSFGFFDSDEENERVLKNFFNALKPQGKFLMHTDVNMPRIISGKYPTHEVRKLRSGKELVVNDSYDPVTKRINGEWVIKDTEGNEEKKSYSIRVYSKEEFIDLCKKVGFSQCVAYGDWDETGYTSESEDMIIIAKK